MSRSSSRYGDFACFAVFLSAVLLSNACGAAAERDGARLAQDAAATAELTRINALLASNRPVTRLDIESLTRLRGQYPDSATVRQLLQGALIKRSDWAAAERIISDTPPAERSEADDLNLAKIYFKQGKFSEAGEVLKKIASPANRVEAIALLGQSQFYAGDLDAAAASLESVVNELVTQKRADDLTVLGTIYFRRGDHRRASDILQGAVAASPENISANNALLRTYAAAGDAAKADALLAKMQVINDTVAAAEKRKSQQVSLFYQLEDAYAAKDFEKVIALVKQIQPEADSAIRPTLYQYLAAAYQAQGKDAEAKNALDEAAKLTPK